MIKTIEEKLADETSNLNVLVLTAHASESGGHQSYINGKTLAQIDKVGVLPNYIRVVSITISGYYFIPIS
jgi:hypothetical protein